MADPRDGLHLIPGHMHDGVLLWIEQGIPPGGFLSAVISNDLSEAVGRADTDNRAALADWVIYFYNYAPRACWGSPDALKTWRGLSPPKKPEQPSSTWGGAP